MSEYTPTSEELRAGQEAYRASGTPMSLAIWLAAHDAEVRASVVAEERGWEYGTRLSVTDGWERGDRYGEYEYIDARSISDNINEDRSTTLPLRDMTRAVRRRKAGPWEPVES